MTRVRWIDSCRFFAIFVIMFTHFLADLRPAALSLWETMPGWLFLGGLTGKFSVAFFFVLLGCFASAPQAFSLSRFAAYGLRRYFQFAFFILLTTLFYIAGCYGVTWLFHSQDAGAARVISDGFAYNLIYLLRDSFLFEDNYNPTLWCMQQLFLASLLCRLFASLTEKRSPAPRIPLCLIVIGLLMLPGRGRFVWITAAMLGVLLRLVLSVLREKAAPKPALLVVLFLLAVCCIKAPLAESPLLYALEGIGAFLLLFVLFHVPWAQALLERQPLPRLGGVSMGLFVVHSPVSSLLFSLLSRFVALESLSPPGLLALFIVLFFLCLICAVLLHRAYSALSRRMPRERVGV